MTRSLAAALIAEGPHPSLGAHAETYGRVIGSWRGELHNHMLSGSKPASIEVDFGWVLDGRAVQDVWVTPARAERGASPAPALNWFGTTLRVFDPASESWRVRWWDPGRQLALDLEGRRHGDDIVHLGTREGRPIRWTFSEMRAETFRWQGHILEPDGVRWTLEVDISLRRTRA
jgi:hypothetical protein